MVSSRRWSYFFWGLIISLVLGSAIRLVFSSERMQAWVSEISARRQLKFQLHFEEAQLTLAPSFPPNLAVQLSGVKVLAQDPCVTGSRIHADRLFIPIGWMGLWRRNLEFGKISADTIQIHYQPPQCTDSLAVPVLDERAAKTNYFEKAENYLQSRWLKEAQNTLRYLDSVQVEEVQLFQPNQSTPVMRLENLLARLNSKNKTAEVTFQLTPSKEILGFAMLGVSHYEMQISQERVFLRGKGNLLEGRYEMIGDWDVESGEIIYEAQVKDFPAGELVQFLEKWDLINLPDLAITNEWFRCKVQLSLSTAKPEEAALQNEKCELYGELGEIAVPDTRRKNVFETLFPIQFRVTNFRIAAVDPEPSELGKSVLPYSGEYSGNLLLHGQQVAETTGEWRKLLLQIPIGQQTLIRRFDSAQVNARIEGRSVSLKLTEIKNEKDNLLGSLELETQKEKRSVADEVLVGEVLTGLNLRWKLNTKGHQQDVSDLIPGLRKVTGLSLQGEGFLQDLNWHAANLSFQLDQGEFFGVELGKGQAQLNVNRGLGHLVAELEQLDLSQIPLGLAKKLESNFQTRKLENVSVDLKFEQDGRWALNPMEMSLNNKTYQLVGRGFLALIDDGLLQPKSGGTSYSASGPILDPRLEKTP